MVQVNITPNGRMSLPIDIRKRLGLENGGSVIVEQIFSIPGMGKYAFEGLLARDFNIVMATTIFVGVMTQFGILLSDITYSIVDPRIRHD